MIKADGNNKNCKSNIKSYINIKELLFSFNNGQTCFSYKDMYPKLCR